MAEFKTARTRAIEARKYRGGPSKKRRNIQKDIHAKQSLKTNEREAQQAIKEWT